MGLAFQQYASDYDSGYPNGCSASSAFVATSSCTASGDPYLWTGQHFRWLIMSYLGFKQTRDPADPWKSLNGANPAILVCPSDTATTFDNTSYGYSATFYHADTVPDQLHMNDLRIAKNAPGAGAICVTRFETEVAFPAQKVLVGEWLNAHVNGGSAYGYWGSGYVAAGQPTSDCWIGARNYVFADGHCKLVQAGRITPSALDISPDIHRTPKGLAGQDIQ